MCESLGFLDVPGRYGLTNSLTVLLIKAAGLTASASWLEETCQLAWFAISTAQSMVNSMDFRRSNGNQFEIASLPKEKIGVIYKESRNGKSSQLSGEIFLFRGIPFAQMKALGGEHLKGDLFRRIPIRQTP